MAEQQPLRFRKTFRLKTIAGIALIEAIVLFIIGWTSLGYLEKSNIINITKNAEATARLFATTTKNALLTTDIASLASFAEGLLLNPRVTYCRIISSDEGLLAESGSSDALAAPFKADTPATFAKDEVYDVRADIEEGGFVYGHVEIGMTTEHLQQLLDEALSQFMFLAGLELVLVALFSLGLGFLLTLQLDSLADAAAKITKGAFGYQIPIKTRDELGHTAHAFNTMSKELEKTYSSLHEALQETTRQKKQLQVSEGRLLGILESIVDALISIDCKGKVLLFNPAAERIFGYSADEVVGRNVSMLMPEPFNDQHDHFLQRYIQHGEARIIGIGREVVGLRKCGEHFPADLSVSELVVGEDRFFIGLLRDITERKQVEKELIVSRRNAEEASDAKSSFLANMSHELRTPLNAILGYAQIIKDEGNISPLQARGVETIQRSGQHLLQLIMDILDISKIEVGNLELDEHVYNLHTLLDSICNMLKVRAAKKDVQFIFWKSPKTPLRIYGDGKRLRQILLNLLTNAVKFTDRGMIVLRVEIIDDADTDKERDDSSQPLTLRFQIQDSGIGIPENLLDTIFKPFYQASDKERNQEGTGLGLAITRQLLHLMDSELFVDSRQGEGSTFWFDLRVDDRQDETVSALRDHTNITGYAGQQRHILVVDDVEDNRKVLKHMLAALHFQIHEASNGVECLKKIAEHVPDIVLLDLRMPVMDGEETLKHIRSNDKLQGLPVIAISATVSDEKRRQILDDGCDGFLPKPFTKIALLEMLSEVLALDWQYSEEPAESATKSDTTETPLPLTQLPEDVINEMSVTARRGNARKLTQIVEAATQHPDTAAWRDIITPLIQDFQFDEIIKIITDRKVP